MFLYGNTPLFWNPIEIDFTIKSLPFYILAEGILILYKNIEYTFWGSNTRAVDLDMSVCSFIRLSVAMQTSFSWGALSR